MLLDVRALLVLDIFQEGRIAAGVIYEVSSNIDPPRNLVLVNCERNGVVVAVVVIEIELVGKLYQFQSPFQIHILIYFITITRQ